MNNRIPVEKWARSLCFVLLFLVGSAEASRAQYIGREPARLGRLADATSGLAEQYARVLQRLQSDRELSFSELRAALDVILRVDPFFADVFEVWLGLNPTKSELRAYIVSLRAREEPAARWQRAEVLLRLDDARRAREALQGIGDADARLRNLRDRALARADFQLKADAVGQAVYLRLLDRLDEGTADLLFQDVAAIASASERQEFAGLGPADRADFFRRFWAGRHPVPVQDQNPRLAEHYRRLARALSEYGLQSNGRGYFTDPDVFQSLTPTLPHFDSTVVFEDGPAARYWLDPRGLLLIRHGDPDVQVGAHTIEGTAASESWLVSRYRSRPLLYHFVKRAPVGEWTLVLNLAVAATRRGAVPDDPEKILPDISRSFLRLYQSRINLHPIYQQAIESHSESDLARALRTESEVMAAFLKAALASDSTAYYTKDNTLPLAVSVSNFYAAGKPAVAVDFATDLSGIDVRTLGEVPSLDVVVTLYDREWKTVRRRVEHTIPLVRPQSGKFKAFVGRVPIDDLEPEDYRMALFVYHRKSGRIGVARGRHEVTYMPEGHVGMSDLVLLRQSGTKAGAGTSDTGAAAVTWAPSPDRVVSRSMPFRIEFELYNFRPDDSGQVRYEVEERVLTLYEEPGLLGKLAGYGNLAGQILFPLYTFIGQSGAQVLTQATASETDGLTISKRLTGRPPATTIAETVNLDLKTLKPGVYTVYVTVRDVRTHEVISRFLTWQID